MNKIKIYTANFSDFKQLQEIVNRAFEGSTQEGLGQLNNGILLNSGTYYYASLDDVALACGGFTLEEPGSNKIVEEIAHIRNFATHPEARKNGLAKAILFECEKQARKLNIKELICFSSLEGENFYKKCGFIEEDRKTLTILNRQIPIIIMRKNI